MSKYIIDESCFPLVYVRYMGEVEAVTWHPYIEGMIDIIKTRRVHAVLNDGRFCGIPNAAERAYSAEKLQEINDLSQLYVAGTSIVHASRIMQGIVTAIHWMRPPKAPLTFHTDVDEAITWLLEQLAIRGVPAPSAATVEAFKALCRKS